jgi:excisionase family DNA binding protein
MPKRRVLPAERRFLGTHEAAEILSVDVRTVIRWADAGSLVAFRTPGGHRRIAWEALIRFARSRGWPLPEGKIPSMRFK